MSDSLGGTWTLLEWRRIAADGVVSFPLGKNARGQLIYGSDGRMAVQIVRADRPPLATDDPLGGSETARADAYSGCLAYFGSYAVEGDTVVHAIDSSLFPNWSGEKQVRPFTLDDGRLVLRTPPQRIADGTTVVNELSWARPKGDPETG